VKKQNDKTGQGDLVIKGDNIGGNTNLIIDVALIHEFGGNHMVNVSLNGKLWHDQPDTLGLGLGGQTVTLAGSAVCPLLGLEKKVDILQGSVPSSLCARNFIRRAQPLCREPPMRQQQLMFIGTQSMYPHLPVSTGSSS
jgi:hypothetical protein